MYGAILSTGNSTVPVPAIYVYAGNRQNIIKIFLFRSMILPTLSN